MRSVVVMAIAGLTIAGHAAAQPARPDSVKALMQQAREQAERKDSKAAFETLQRARSLAPNAESVLLAYGQTALLLRLPVAALSALEPLARMHPTTAQYHYLQGVAFLQAADMYLASEALERARQLEPDRVLTLIGLGVALNQRKRYEEARPHLARSLELDPSSLEAMAALAESEAGRGDFMQAEHHARRVLARAPGDATANLVMGLVRFERGQYTEAASALERAAAAEPSAPKTHYQLSLAYARMGDETRSRAALARYRQGLKEMEARVVRIRTEAGVSTTGDEKR